jgi:hypothetical protein
MKDDTASRRLYLELTAHLVDREIAKFRRGEQAALVSLAKFHCKNAVCRNTLRAVSDDTIRYVAYRVRV